MSLNFSQDTSTQLTYSSFGFTTPQLDNFATSNQLLITSNQIINKINTDITGINTNLTTNYYTKTSTDTLLNTKENTLTFSSPLTRSTNTIGINLSSYSTTGNDTNYLLKSGGNMTGAIVNTSTTTSEFKAIQINHPARISHIPYTNNQIYLRAPVIIDNTADFLSFGSRTGDFIIKMFGEDYGFGINGYTLRYNAALSASHKFYTGSTLTFTISDTGNITSIGSCTATSFVGVGSSLSQLNYNNITLNKPTNFQSDWSSTVINKPSVFPPDLTNIYTKTEADNLLATKQPNLTSATTLLGNGNSITNINYNNIPNRLIFLSPLSSNANNQVSIDLSSYTNTTGMNTVISTASTNTSNYISTKILPLIGGVMTGQITGVSTINGTTAIFGTVSTTNNGNANTPQLGVYGGTGDRFILYVGTASVYPYSLGINSDVMWYSVPATASHIFYVGGSPKATISSTGLSTTGLINASTNLQEAGVNLTSKYLKLDGTNTMSGALNITSTTTDNQIVITNSSATNYTSIKFNNGTKNGYIGVGGSGLTGTSYYNNNVFIEANNSLIFQSGNQGTGSVPRMIINTSGNVGIATTNPNNIFQVGDGARLKISNGISSFSLIGTKDVDDGTNTRIVISGNTRAGSLGNIEYVATGSGNHIFYTTDSTTQRMIINTSGNVGIGTATSASFKLNVGGAINAAGNFNSFFGGLRLNGFDTGNTIWQDTGNLGISANTGNNILFNIGNGGEKMRIKSNGYVGINNTDPKSALYVNGIVGINNGSEYAITNNNMASGSLTIGGTNANYGCGNNWTSSTAGLMMECLDNTEIAIHDSGNRVVSPMAYYGGPGNNRIYIGRDAGWGSTPITISNSLSVEGTINANGNKLNFTTGLDKFKINLWGTNSYGFGIDGGTLQYTSGGVHKFYTGNSTTATLFSDGSLELPALLSSYGIRNKSFNQPLIVSYTLYQTGNPTTVTSYNKLYSFCIFYVNIKEYNSNPGVFGIYMGANITAGASYAPTLQYNGGITNYVPYFTNQSANATVMWVYNATAYLQISVTEFWFN